MSSSSRSRSGMARNRDGRFCKGGSSVQVKDPVQSKQNSVVPSSDQTRSVTRSRSGAALDVESGVCLRGSKAVNAVSGRIQQVQESGVVLAKQQVVSAVQVEAAVSAEDDVDSAEVNEVSECESDRSSFNSSSPDSDFDNEDVGRSVEQQGLCSTQLKQVGDLVAQHVFGEMPHSHPVATGVNLGGGSRAEVSEKGAGCAPKAPWVNLFKDNRNLGNGIKLHEVQVDGDLVQLGEEDVYEVDDAVGICLVGLFTGKFPGVGAVQRLKDGWKVECKHWIHRSGWILFEFQSEDDRLKVLNGGPYFAYGRNLMIKMLPRCFRFGSEEMTSVPVWIQLPDLPFDCWNDRALSKIVSKVGVPITTDKLTRTIERISFARVLVEVDISKELVTSVEVKLPTGVVYDQVVVFESTPNFCKKCKTFSHGDVGCNNVSGGSSFPAFVPKRKVHPGGMAKSNFGHVAGYKGGAGALGGKTGFGKSSALKSAVLSDEMGRPVPCVSGSKVVQDATPAVVPVPSVAGEGVIQSAGVLGSGLLVAVPGEGRNVGCTSGQAGATSLPALAGKTANPVTSPLCSAAYLDTCVVGVVEAAIKGKQMMLSGQQGAAAVLQHPDVEINRLKPVCPAVGLDAGDVGWTRVGKKGKQKMMPGQPGVAAVHHQSDGEVPHASSASVSRGLKGKALHPSK